MFNNVPDKVMSLKIHFCPVYDWLKLFRQDSHYNDLPCLGRRGPVQSIYSVNAKYGFM